jgi:predicted metallopeptidase
MRKRLVTKGLKTGFNWDDAPDVRLRVVKLVKDFSLEWINIDRVFFKRSYNSKSRAYARIWGLGRIWQETLQEKPAYIIEVLSEKFDRLNKKRKDEILLHEIAHIPRNFSGSLIPHFRKGNRKFGDIIRSLYANHRRPR